MKAVSNDLNSVKQRVVLPEFSGTKDSLKNYLATKMLRPKCFCI